MFGGEEVADEVVESTKKEDVRISLTFNNQEWVDALSFKYHDVDVTRIVYATTFGEDLETEEEKDAAWLAPDVPPPPPEEEPTEEEIEK